MENIHKPDSLESSVLSQMIFHRRDIYDMLCSVIKNVKADITVLHANDVKLSNNTEEIYKDIIKRISDISSNEIELDFVPKDGSVTLAKLAEDVKNLLSNNIEIDTENDLLIDKNTNKAYKLTPVGEAFEILFGSIHIDKFTYDSETAAIIPANGGSLALDETKLQFSQDKTTRYPDGSSKTEVITGSSKTPGAVFEFEFINKPENFDNIKANGAINAWPNPTLSTINTAVKLTKAIVNGVTTEHSMFASISQAAGRFDIQPTVTLDNLDHYDAASAIKISYIKTAAFVDVEANVTVGEDFCYAEPSATSDTIAIFIEENTSTSQRIATIEVKARIVKNGIKTDEYITKIVTVKQNGVAAPAPKFYYGSADSINSIPQDVSNLTSTILTDFNISVNITERHRIVWVNVPEDYLVEYIKDSDGDNNLDSNYITVGDRRIYHTVYGDMFISNSYSIKVKKNG